MVHGCQEHSTCCELIYTCGLAVPPCCKLVSLHSYVTHSTVQQLQSMISKPTLHTSGCTAQTHTKGLQERLAYERCARPHQVDVRPKTGGPVLHAELDKLQEPVCAGQHSNLGKVEPLPWLMLPLQNQIKQLGGKQWSIIRRETDTAVACCC